MPSEGNVMIRAKYKDDNVEQSLERVRKSLLGISGASQQSTRNMSKSFINAKAKAAELEAALTSLDAKREAISSRYLQEYSELPYNKAELYSAVESALNADKEYQKLGREIESTTNKLEGYRIKMEQAKNATEKAGSATRKATGDFRKMAKESIPLTKSILSVANMFKLMMLRMAIRGVMRSMQQGFKDLAVSSTHFNGVMSQLQSSLLQARNSITAAFAPAVEALTPVIIRLANGFIDAMNAVAAFNAYVFNGSKTFMKAKKVQVDYAKSLGQTEKALNRLAAFDELNILSKGEVDTGLPKPEDMFEEVPINNFERLDDIFKDILWYTGTIGAGLAAWKITNLLSDIGFAKIGLKEMAGTTLAITGTIVFAKGWFDAFKNGADWKNFTEMLAGSGLALGGLFMLNFVAGAIGSIVLGIGALFVGIWDAIKRGFNWINGLLIPLGTTLMGVGIGALIGMAGGPIGAGIGALIGLVVGLYTDLTIWIIQNWEKVSAFFKDLWGTIAGFFVDAWESIADIFRPAATWFNDFVVKPIVSFFSPITDTIGKMFSALWEVIKVVVKNITDIIVGVGRAFWAVASKIIEIVSTMAKAAWAVFSWLFGLVTDFLKKIAKVVWDTALMPVITFVKRFVTNLVNEFVKIVSAINDKVIKPVLNFFKEMIDKVIGFFKNIGIKVAEGISGAFKTVLNKAFGLVESVVNLFIKGLNGALGLINKIPGINIKKVEELHIPKLATGGIATAPTAAIIGERGREAVLPLENNTGWMDMLAERLASKMAVSFAGVGTSNETPPNVYVYIGNDQLDAYISKSQYRNSIRTNGR